MGRGAISRGNRRRRRAAKLALEKEIRDATVLKLRQETRIVFADCVHTNYGRIECISLPNFYESSHSELFTSGYDAILFCEQSATTPPKPMLREPTIIEVLVCSFICVVIFGTVVLGCVGCWISFLFK